MVDSTADSKDESRAAPKGVYSAESLAWKRVDRSAAETVDLWDQHWALWTAARSVDNWAGPTAELKEHHWAGQKAAELADCSAAWTGESWVVTKELQKAAQMVWQRADSKVERLVAWWVLTKAGSSAAS